MLMFRRGFSSFHNPDVSLKYSVGNLIHDYKIKRVFPVPESKFTVVDLEHERTGAQHLHIDRNDDNNVFSIGFKSNAFDSTGIPHILEHTSLCGSKNYPVRDPFFKMLNRTIANFMNAMTGQDYIFYPFATTNIKDFTNLRGLYLDSTLNPLLKYEDFLQEGWRLEYSDVNDKNSPIIFKGVVYNEMKGQISNANYYFWMKFLESIYPSLNNSGGNPEKITDLKYDDLVEYHKRYFHPSNSKTFTYGKFPVDDTLADLSAEFAGYSKIVYSEEELRPISLVKDVNVEIKSQLDPILPDDRQQKMSMSWICGRPENVYETFLLGVLGSLLFDTHSSPFYKGLIETGLGYDFSVNTGVDSQTAANFLTIGVNGCSDVSVTHSAIQSIFKDVMETPFEEKKIEAILHQIELSKKDQRSNFGLQLLYAIMPGWVNKTDPVQVLSIRETLERFRKDWAAEGDQVFKGLLEKYVFQKPYFKFVMKGDENFSKEFKEKEQKRLEEKVSSLTDADKESLYRRGLELQKSQNSKQDLSLLPTLSINDISRASTFYPVTIEKHLRSRITNTNGITYFRGKKSLDDVLPYELYPYLPLFAESLTNLGTATEEYSKIEEQIQLNTGGISASVSVSSTPVNCDPVLEFNFMAWSLNKNTCHIFELLKKILCDTDFKANKDKLKVLIKTLLMSKTASVSEEGHIFASVSASAYLHPSNAINESLSGIGQVSFLTRLSGFLEDDAKFQTEIVEKLQLIKDCIISSEGMQFMVTTDSDAILYIVKFQVSDFFIQLPKPKFTKNRFLTKSYPVPVKPDLPIIIDFPFQVHHVAQTLKGVPYTHKDGAALQVLANLLTFNFLHCEIREKGSAYGGGATYNALDGVFSFYSYRDPHPLNSLKTFDGACNYVLCGTNWSASNLDEAKLNIFQKVDAPISAKNEGSINFSYNISDQMRQKRRENLLDVSLDDVYSAAERYLANPGVGSRVSAIIGPQIPKLQCLVNKI